MNDVKYKICTKCKRNLSIESFGIRNKTKNTYTSWCRECTIVEKRERYQRNNEIKQKAKKENDELKRHRVEKSCSKCGAVKKLSEFYENKACLDGHINVCNDCRSKNAKEYVSKKIIIETKKCACCKKIKPINEFDKNKSAKDLYNSYCKECKYECQKLYIERKDKKRKEFGKEIYEKYCKCCGVVKPINSFQKNKKIIDGYGTKCKDCLSTKIIKPKSNIVRVCSCCGVEKSIDDFYNNKKFLDNIDIRCKECYKNKITKQNPIIDGMKFCSCCMVYKPLMKFPKGTVCKECSHKRHKEYRKENKEKIRIQRKENTKKYPYNKEKAKLRYEKKKNDPNYKIKANIKASMYGEFSSQNVKKTKETIKYGINITEIVSKLGPRPSDEYTIDHIIPLVAFDYSIDEHVRLSQHPNNLRWILGVENSSKNDFIVWDLIESDGVLLNIANILNITKENDGKHARDIKNNKGVV